MGDRSLSAFDVLDIINKSAGDNLPANWLTCLCVLPIVGEAVPATELARDLGQSVELMRNLNGSEDQIRWTLGSSLLAVLQIAQREEIDIGLALLETIGRELENEPTGEADP